MIITKFFVTGYKNLVDCELAPIGLHAITGCNSTGKSNCLEVLPFVASLISGSDTQRKAILTKGWSPNGVWFPCVIERNQLRDFEFHLHLEITIGEIVHSVSYELELQSTAINTVGYPQPTEVRIGRELLKAKPLGQPGKIKTLLNRDSAGWVTLNGAKSDRSREVFKCRPDMSALQALSVLMVDDFEEKLPEIFVFNQELQATSLVRLDPEGFKTALTSSNRSSTATLPRAGIISSYDPYYALHELKKDPRKWDEFKLWLDRLVGIKDLVLHEAERNTGSPLAETTKFIFPLQNGRLIQASELSMGGTIVLGHLIGLYALLDKGGVALFEEPENFLHPKAVMNLISLFKEISVDHTVIISTHSPVVLNSLSPKQVTVMKPLGNGLVTTKNVGDIKEAVDALNRGFVNFGDLLQTDYEQT